jgi:hypothetical protein
MNRDKEQSRPTQTKIGLDWLVRLPMNLTD